MCCYTVVCFVIFQPQPCVGCAVVKIDPLCFLAGCHTRRLNQAVSLLVLVLFFIVLLLIMATFCVKVYVDMCSAFWLFWLRCQYLPSDWLQSLL